MLDGKEKRSVIPYINRITTGEKNLFQSKEIDNLRLNPCKSTNRSI